MKTSSREQLLKQIGERVKELRANLNQEDFAISLNTIKQTISKYEKGKIMPGGDFLFELLTKNNINLNWLFTGKGEKYIDYEFDDSFEYSKVADKQVSYSANKKKLK